MQKLVFIAVLVISTVLSACRGQTVPLAQTMAAEQVNIMVTSNPSPAVLGAAELIFTITDANGSPLEGANVRVATDDTDMIGMGMNGSATEQGDGKYFIDTNFRMRGTWKLTLYLRKDALDYKEEMKFEVE